MIRPLQSDKTSFTHCPPKVQVPFYVSHTFAASHDRCHAPHPHPPFQVSGWWHATAPVANASALSCPDWHMLSISIWDGDRGREEGTRAGHAGVAGWEGGLTDVVALSQYHIPGSINVPFYRLIDGW